MMGAGVMLGRLGSCADREGPACQLQHTHHRFASPDLFFARVLANCPGNLLLTKHSGNFYLLSHSQEELPIDASYTFFWLACHDPNSPYLWPLLSLLSTRHFLLPSTPKAGSPFGLRSRTAPPTPICKFNARVQTPGRHSKQASTCRSRRVFPITYWASSLENCFKRKSGHLVCFQHIPCVENSSSEFSRQPHLPGHQLCFVSLGKTTEFILILHDPSLPSATDSPRHAQLRTKLRSPCSLFLLVCNIFNSFSSQDVTLVCLNSWCVLPCNHLSKPY